MKRKVHSWTLRQISDYARAREHRVAARGGPLVQRVITGPAKADAQATVDHAADRLGSVVDRSLGDAQTRLDSSLATANARLDDSIKRAGRTIRTNAALGVGAGIVGGTGTVAGVRALNDRRKSKVGKAATAEQKLAGKQRDAAIGLANNAFGATAGAIATRAAMKHRPRTTADMAATRTGRFMLKHKVNPKIAIPAAGTALVGMQAVNGAMDAQSAAYFSGELKELRDKRATMRKADEPAGQYIYLLPTIREEAGRPPQLMAVPVDPLQMFAASQIALEGTDKLRSRNPFGRKKRRGKGAYELAMGTQMLKQPIGSWS